MSRPGHGTPFRPPHGWECPVCRGPEARPGFWSILAVAGLLLAALVLAGCGGVVVLRKRAVDQRLAAGDERLLTQMVVELLKSKDALIAALQEGRACQEDLRAARAEAQRPPAVIRFGEQAPPTINLPGHQLLPFMVPNNSIPLPGALPCCPTDRGEL